MPCTLTNGRYVQDLYKLNETFCKALLPQPEQSPSLSLPDPLALSRTMSSATDGSDARLPIAAQFASQRFSSDSFRDAPPTMPSVAEAQRSDGDAARQVAYDTLTRAKTKEPHPASSRSGSGTRKRLSFNTNSKRESGHGRKSSIGSITADGPVTLPDDLEQVRLRLGRDNFANRPGAHCCLNWHPRGSYQAGNCSTQAL